MHELSICRELVKLIEHSVQGQQVHRIKKINLDLGRFSHLEESALVFCFDVVTKGSVAEGAELHINRLGARGLCKACGNEQSLELPFESCAKCGEFPVPMSSGDEMRLKSLEVF